MPKEQPLPRSSLIFQAFWKTELLLKKSVQVPYFFLKLEGYSYLQKTIFTGFQLPNFPGLSDNILHFLILTGFVSSLSSAAYKHGNDPNREETTRVNYTQVTKKSPVLFVAAVDFSPLPKHEGFNKTNTEGNHGNPVPTDSGTFRGGLAHSLQIPYTGSLFSQVLPDFCCFSLYSGYLKWMENAWGISNLSCY